MLLEWKLDYRSSSQMYEKIFLRVLEELSLQGKILREHFILKLYVEAEDSEILEKFIEKFSLALPHSIFLYASEAKIIDEMPSDIYELKKRKKLPLPFCPTCLDEVMDENHVNYYNIFTECNACGYSVQGETKSYKKEFENAAKEIAQGKILKLNTFYGAYSIGLPTATCNLISYDMLCYDLATIEKYTHVEKYEITSLGAVEKPLITCKKKMKFIMDYEDVEADLIRFKLPDDFILHLLMEELHRLGIDMVFISSDSVKNDAILILNEFRDNVTPIEVVASEKDLVVVKGNKGLPNLMLETKNPTLRAFYSVMKEHKLEDEVVASINLSKKYDNNILMYGEKFGVLEYISFKFEFDSLKEIFNEIQETNDSGMKIVENYQKKFPEHFERISHIVFEEKSFNLYTLWGIVAIVLDFTKSTSPYEAAKVLEENAISFLGDKGPRIDYKLLKKGNTVSLDALMTIRTAMSFKLAGVDQLGLSYGVIESFLEFIANEVDDMKEKMEVTSFVATGSLLENKRLFSKMSKEISINHPLYFNNQISIEMIEKEDYGY
ncbi:MAG: hydrogenase [Sulfurovum sp.]|nr:hydrogenase [Sulfurovum sp.]